MKQKLFTRNFILLILGQASSLAGNYMLRLALSMFVLEVTGSAAVFAGILSAATVPAILLSPFGGVLADRADRRKIMVALDILTGSVVLCGAVFLTRDNAPAGVCLLLVERLLGSLCGLAYALAGVCGGSGSFFLDARCHLGCFFANAFGFFLSLLLHGFSLLVHCHLCGGCRYFCCFFRYFRGHCCGVLVFLFHIIHY